MLTLTVDHLVTLEPDAMGMFFTIMSCLIDFMHGLGLVFNLSFPSSLVRALDVHADIMWKSKYWGGQRWLCDLNTDKNGTKLNKKKIWK